ncbi:MULTISPECIES: DUF2974 domain-containing protein [Weissella]|uniref:DUF2974 domain-containing protein n=1 Tax=Weissella fermenti TaxID=2987699 RepID=A0ABT6D4I1_9LACO|nr:MULTISPECIES: DUF2974 domain-containing protein [unclassified Weissella]MCW0926022.1 DUF2974 domain-containing protein [Weissella sp. LMG 11983]MDF9300429.1 DUF2974 domain-containing protein [Weissella sp. BK2]
MQPKSVSSDVVSATSSALSQLTAVKASDVQTKTDIPSLAEDKNIKTHMDMINNLIYLPSFWQSMGMSVTQWASYQNPTELANEMRQSMLFPEATIKAFINSLVTDYNFWSQMQVKNVTAKLFDSGSLVHYFTMMYKNDEIIAYQGTSGDDEWLDNAKGITQTDTVEQGTAQWYFDAIQQTYNANHAKKVYVTGHSKGGNKAMYVGVTRGDQIEHVYAFDGQGFGKDFFRKYSDQIVKNQSKITLISNSEDYINIMMWPIAGEKIYIKSQATFGLADLQALIGLKSNNVFGLLNEIGHNMLMDRFGAIHSPVSMLTVDAATNTVKMADATSQNAMISMLHQFVETGMMYLDKDQLNYFAEKAVSLFISPAGAVRLGIDKLVKPAGFDFNMGLTVAAFMHALTPSELLSVAESLPEFVAKF